MSRKKTEEEIDELVIAQAGQDSAWEEPIKVKRRDAAHFSLPPELAARAAFLARVHRAGGIEAWLARIIRERIELEEVAFAAAKRELAARSNQ